METPSTGLDTPDSIAVALAELSARDPVIGEVLRQCGQPPPRRRDPGFEGLAHIVVGQQVSTASASAIWARLRALVEPFEPETLSRHTDEGLRGAGLSRPKVRTLRAVAEAATSGAIDFAELGGLDADTAHARLCAIHGIGPWTADIYLLFCLGHADAWPAGDLALQHAAGAALGLDARPDARQMATLGERWRPLRGAAALLLWAYYRHLRGRAGVAV
ncbi:DNA-3-methyladenine glycosylase 2 family protein [Microbaculum marinum]|uniref:DNA-3-methyladenine glycosylase II n=1 Tax=Microbaculum marinum TaxID=1764581 RepID=A0AAW9RAD8_9HYPH